MRLLNTFRYSIILTIHKLRKDEDAFASTLIDFVKKQGGLYIKFMQILAVQTGLLSEKHMVGLLSLYDEAGFEEIDIHKKVRDELGEKSNELTDIQRVPFSAGAFAQVYKAKLLDGTPVIIKVRKQNLKVKLLIDFSFISLMLYLIDSIYKIPLVNPHRLLGEFRKNTFNELDYKREVENAKYLYKCYEQNPLVKVPFTFSELCTKNIIVQEYVQGLLLTNLLRAKSSDEMLYQKMLLDYGLQIDTILKRIAYTISLQGPKFNRFYGDPHPGNIILTGGENFAFIDFGILDNVAIDKENFFKIMKSVVDLESGSDLSDLSQEMIKFGATDLYESLEVLDSSSGKKSKLLKSVSGNYSSLLNEKISGFLNIKNDVGGFTQIFYEIIKTGNKFNIKVPEILFNMMRSSAMFASYASYLLPDEDVMPEVYRKLLEEFQNDLTNESPVRKKPDIEQAVVYLAEWLTGIAESDLTLYNKIRKLVDKNLSYV